MKRFALALGLGLGLVFLGAMLALGFVAYQQPELLLQTSNLRYCG